MRLALVVSRFNPEVTMPMRDLAVRRAEAKGAEVVSIVEVPGTMEVPLALDRLLSHDDIDGARTMEPNDAGFAALQPQVPYNCFGTPGFSGGADLDPSSLDVLFHFQGVGVASLFPLLDALHHYLWREEY